MTDENGKPVKRLKDEVKFEFFRTIVADINKFRPITMVELCYVATYMALRGKCCTVTRYPVLNIENLVPCKIHLMTTTPGRVVSLCTSVNDTAVVFPEYPVLGNIHSILKQSVSLHPTTLELLGADHDGDTISLNILMSDEATNEINKFLESKSSMLTSTGTLLYNLSTKWVIPISFLFATSHKLS